MTVAYAPGHRPQNEPAPLGEMDFSVVTALRRNWRVLVALVLVAYLIYKAK